MRLVVILVNSKFKQPRVSTAIEPLSVSVVDFFETGTRMFLRSVSTTTTTTGIRVPVRSRSVRTLPSVLTLRPERKNSLMFFHRKTCRFLSQVTTSRQACYKVDHMIAFHLMRLWLIANQSTVNKGSISETRILSRKKIYTKMIKRKYFLCL